MANDDGLVPDADTVFPIASMTKSFVACAALIARDAGHLSLADPLAAAPGGAVVRERAVAAAHGGVDVDAVERFVERMDDDLDAPGALADVFGLVNRANAAAEPGVRSRYRRSLGDLSCRVSDGYSCTGVMVLTLLSSSAAHGRRPPPTSGAGAPRGAP